MIEFNAVLSQLLPTLVSFVAGRSLVFFLIGKCMRWRPSARLYPLFQDARTLLLSVFLVRILFFQWKDFFFTGEEFRQMDDLCACDQHMKANGLLFGLAATVFSTNLSDGLFAVGLLRSVVDGHRVLTFQICHLIIKMTRSLPHYFTIVSFNIFAMMAMIIYCDSKEARVRVRADGGWFTLTMLVLRLTLIVGYSAFVRSTKIFSRRKRMGRRPAASQKEK